MQKLLKKVLIDIEVYRKNKTLSYENAKSFYLRKEINYDWSKESSHLTK